ncbi:MAG: UDP-2,4-diacetamido-2,4,6-trideoxy-beta-L-altropyranose hydrolase [Bacteroidota bacterium]|nr:UDP-2,4-diacetamido-2,4,6-trideoxy-beta-L-altropyranose hydrolase [Bacteroidota bacterium]
MSQKIVIRADGGTDLGMGHIIRCLALADMLREDFIILFAVQSTQKSLLKFIHSVTATVVHLPPTIDFLEDAKYFSDYLSPDDIVILDGYHFNTEYQKIIKSKCAKLVSIDDLHSWHQFADVVINHAGGISATDYSTESYTQLCLGPRYALLRKEFLSDKFKRGKISSIEKVFISMGASDVNNITSKFVSALSAFNSIKEIHLMLGTINPNLESLDQQIKSASGIKIFRHFDIPAEELKSLLNSCDISICPASSISIESCAVGIGLLTGHTAANQLSILDGLMMNKAAINLGDLKLISVDEIQQQLSPLIKNPQLLETLITNQAIMIDGHSPKRFRELFKKLTPVKLQFRMANEADLDQYYKWANDELVREQSYNQNKVSLEEHRNWFGSKLNSPDCFFYLFHDQKNTPVGQVRIDKSSGEIIIGISIDHDHRGKNLGKPMLEKAYKHYFSKNPEAIIYAYIKNANYASYAAFKKAGFIDQEEIEVHGVKSYKLYKKSDQ